MVTLPTVVRVGPTDYTVSYAGGDAELFGETNNKAATIELAPWQAAGPLRDTLTHEVLHAVMWCSGASHVLDLDHDTEEALVRLLAPALLAVLRDNPALVDTLREGAGRGTQ